MQAQIDILEDRMNTVNPQCYWPTVTAASPDCYNYPLSLSAARSQWPMLEHEFDEYCMKNELTHWTKADSLDFYNKYVGLRSRFWVDTFSTTWILNTSKNCMKLRWMMKQRIFG